MGGTPLRERLDRLRREPSLSRTAVPPPTTEPAADEPVPGPEGLRHLEQSLLGETAEGLSLKARLERLVAVAASRDRVRRPPRVPLEEMVAGRTVANERGEFFLAEASLSLDELHGDVPLARLRGESGSAISILVGEPGFESFELGRAVFVDTETTGLAGGTGTAAFLVGAGFVRDDRFVVRQYFMRDFHEEPALLFQLAEDLAGFSEVVTFNGKMFDLPLLESRFRLNRTRFHLADAAHLDLLHPARRLWKARLESCRLVHLESQLLRVRRVEDIPGDAIPQAYFDYIRGGEAHLLGRVFHHNRIDIISLAALAALACQWVTEPGMAEDARDVLSLARVLERARDDERSEREYLRALDGAGAVRRASLLRLAARAKHAGDLDRALLHWERAAAEGDLGAYRELAVLHEHYLRDVTAALAVVETGLATLAGERDVPLRLSRDLEHRRQRLLRRSRRRGDGAG